MELSFSFHEAYAPGNSILERLDELHYLGFTTIELNTESVRRDKGISAYRAVTERHMRVNAICGGIKGCLLSDDLQVRQLAFDDIRLLLRAGSQLGAAGVVVVPIIGPPRLPDLRPWLTREAVHEKLLVELLSRLAEDAEEAKCAIWLEPLNRYRTGFINRLEQAVSICEKVDSPWIRLMADTFHMALEESDLSTCIHHAERWLSHIHIVDSNRKLPGQGTLDFAPILKSLAEINYTGYLSFECPVEGNFQPEVSASRAYVQSKMQHVIAGLTTGALD